ncbi:MAG TPA: ATP-dependent Clp protease proteolytic subunit [Candidatus Eisenbergiella merdipullorum]|uniref:ATP-dependent Clp protease proteolytic subunit n=1 Tax=Candidatus Eisenbergiella merdipullorum TaxID=2838553 RepID=A0A9D2IA80_9FIRM|nr:ATP-dependent Clp protease proteolytic subunit [Candidatus Eisenbergiella merdipullorum]
MKHLAESIRQAGKEEEKQGNKTQDPVRHEEERKDDRDGGESKQDLERQRDERIEQTGQLTLERHGEDDRAIHMISIIGEIEGHDNLSSSSKTTKYEHILPQLAAIEDSSKIEGLLILLNTMGGDVEAGLAIAEMIASLSKPTVSLVLGGGHSIGVPIAVSADYSFIVPSGTMVIHPVRMSGTVIGAPQTFDYFKQIQDRITGFVCSHCAMTRSRMEKMMMETGILTKDLGTILVGKEAVDAGLIDEVGGIKEAIAKLHAMAERSG